jgi:hypothetical protein
LRGKGKERRRRKINLTKVDNNCIIMACLSIPKAQNSITFSGQQSFSVFMKGQFAIG